MMVIKMKKKGDVNQFDSDIETNENVGKCDEVKIEASEIQDVSEMKIPEKNTIWENNFIALQNEIMQLESVPKRKRTNKQRDELNALKKKYYKKKTKYPHLLLVLKNQKKTIHGILKTKSNWTPCFGSGTKSSPLVKFYFTSPCPQLGKEII